MDCKHRPKQFAWIVILRMYTDGILTCARCGKRITHKKQRYVFTFVGVMVAICLAFVSSIVQQEFNINDGFIGYKESLAFILRLFILNWFLARPITVKYCDEYELVEDE